jgi:hypothetical protein
MSPATAAAQTQRKPRPSPSTHLERPPGGAVLGVTAPYADRAAAARAAAHVRRDLATVAAGLDRPR